MSNEIYSRVIAAYPDYQIRLVVNEFHGSEYLHIRKYFLDFDETWKPSKEGLHVPLDLSAPKELFIGLVEILSLAESKEIIVDNFKELIEGIY